MKALLDNDKEKETETDRRLLPQKPPSVQSPSFHSVQHLHQTLGNYAVGRLLQAKLTVNQPDDEYEQEADRVAEQIMRMAEPSAVKKKCACGQSTAGECEECSRKQALIQRKSSTPASGVEAPPIVNEVLNSPGQPLDTTTRQFMESRFGEDFSQVRLHTDLKAAESADAVSARAYTVGRDVVFGQGHYQPGGSKSKSLVAHELVHVLQQTSSNSFNNNRLFNKSRYIQREPKQPEYNEGQIVVFVEAKQGIKVFRYGVEMPKTPLGTKEGNIRQAYLSSGDLLKIKKQHKDGYGQWFEATIIRSKEVKYQNKDGVVRKDWIRPASVTESEGFSGSITTAPTPSASVKPDTSHPEPVKNADDRQKQNIDINTGIWFALPREAKERLVGKALEHLPAVIEKIPEQEFGPTGFILKEGFSGFFSRLRSADVKVQVTVIDKIFLILMGRSKAFLKGYTWGLLVGFFRDGALGIFIAIKDLVVTLPKLFDFFEYISKLIGHFPQDVARIVQSFKQLTEELVQNSQTYLEDLRKLLDPSKTAELMTFVTNKARQYIRSFGDRVAGWLLEFLSKEGAEETMGEVAGNALGQILWEVAFAALTSGAGAALTATKEGILIPLKGALAFLTKTAGSVAGKATSGMIRLFEEGVKAFEFVSKEIKAFAQAIIGKAKEFGHKVAGLFEDIISFFKRLLGVCYEGSLVCDFCEETSKLISSISSITKSRTGAMKELASKIHGLHKALKGQAIAVVEVKVGGQIRYAAAANSGKKFTPIQKNILKMIGIEEIPSWGDELVHAEVNVEKWLSELKKEGKHVQVIRWGVSATKKGDLICPACRTLIKHLGGVIEEFPSLGKTY